MEIKVVHEKDATVVAVTGEININTSTELRKCFIDLLDQKVKHIVVDFDNVKYIDSSGLAVLIEMFQQLKTIDGSMALANLKDKLNGIFEITKIDMLFSFFNSREDAVASFQFT